MTEQRNKIQDTLAMYGISLSCIAAECGCDKSTVSRFFSGYIKRDRKGIITVSLKMIRAAKKEEEKVAAVLVGI